MINLNLNFIYFIKKKIKIKYLIEESDKLISEMYLNIDVPYSNFLDRFLKNPIYLKIIYFTSGWVTLL
jgi:hypothetical protein